MTGQGRRRRPEREPDRPHGEWGGRIGARLEELDRAARHAFQEAADAMRRRDVIRELAWPVVAAAAAFALGVAIAVGRRTGWFQRAVSR